MDAHLVVEQVDRTADNVRAFKKLTNTIVGRGLQVPENNDLYFGYRVSHNCMIKTLVAVGSCRPALTSVASSGSTHDWQGAPSTSAHALTKKATDGDTTAGVSSTQDVCDALGDLQIDSLADGFDRDSFLIDSCHVIEYLFVDPYYQRSGYGSLVLQAMERDLLLKDPAATLRLWAAASARKFFLANHYKLLSQEASVQCTTIQRFKHLYPMEKVGQGTKTEAKKRRRPKKRPQARPV